jgi:transposase
MPKSHAPYPQEYRQQILELARAGRSAEELAKEFEPSAQRIRNWIKQDKVDRGQRQDGLPSEGRVISTFKSFFEDTRKHETRPISAKKIIV